MSFLSPHFGLLPFKLKLFFLRKVALGWVHIFIGDRFIVIVDQVWRTQIFIGQEEFVVDS